MTSALGLGARVLCVFVLLALVLWVLKRTDGLGARRRSTPVQVLSTTRLGKSATLSVVRVHDEEHVLAVTGSAVTVVSTRPATTAEAVPAAAPAAPAPRPTPPSAAEFLRGGWQVLRKQPVATLELADDEVGAALARACTASTTASLVPATPAAPDFAADLASALRVVEPATLAAPVAEPEPVAVPALRAVAGHLAARTSRRCRPEARPVHLRAPRRAALPAVEDGTA